LDLSLFIASWLVKTTIEGPERHVEQTEVFIAMEKAFNFQRWAHIIQFILIIPFKLYYKVDQPRFHELIEEPYILGQIKKKFTQKKENNTEFRD
jgi:hypothetical protein